MILKILLPLSINKLFLYKAELDSEKIKIGMLVLVDFRGKEVIGIVWEEVKEFYSNIKIKNIKRIYEKLILNSEIRNSIKFFSLYSCNTLSSISKLFLSNFSKKYFGREIKKNSAPTSPKILSNNLKLNNEQRKALIALRNFIGKNFNVCLLEGVTNSGKTRVYMKTIIETLNMGLQCLILVPEKILTKQWVAELSKDFGFEPEVFHSSIPQKKRSQIWINIIQGKNKIIIGTRSALFLPFKNLGLIVIDEEHDSSFKQEDGIIMNVRDFAVVRAKYAKCLIILTSATPSIETLYNCKIKKYVHLKLKKRVGYTKHPKVKIIDMRKERIKKNYCISETLFKEINDSLKKKKQSLIFLNKRGYATFLICKKCGFVKKCLNCDFSLVLHKKEKVSFNDYLLCHYCNHKEEFINSCSNCENINTLLPIGYGVDRINEEINELFPEARTCIISSDIVNSPKSLEAIVNSILEKRIDIIIGTQITSKGHHFPDLKTVGIINIDSILTSFDLRSSEKTFQLITQVAGRAGREDETGKVLIQTYQPDHPVINSFVKNKKNKFQDWELNNRRENHQPPFVSLISIIVEGKDENALKKKSYEIVGKIKLNFKSAFIYGPAPAFFFKLRNKYRWRILIKIKKNSTDNSKIKDFLVKLKDIEKIKVKIDVDPQSFF